MAIKYYIEGLNKKPFLFLSLLFSLTLSLSFLPLSFPPSLPSFFHYSFFFFPLFCLFVYSFVSFLLYTNLSPVNPQPSISSSAIVGHTNVMPVSNRHTLIKQPTPKVSHSPNKVSRDSPSAIKKQPNSNTVTSVIHNRSWTLRKMDPEKDRGGRSCIEFTAGAVRDLDKTVSSSA